MAVYKYKAKKGPDEIVQGKVEAQSEKEAIEKINQLGYVPVQLCEEAAGAPVVCSPISLLKSKGKIKSRDITVFSRQLASLLKSGVPILSALNIICEQSENPRLREVLRNINNSVKEGASFSSTLAQYPNIFPTLYVSIINTGENSGSLPDSLLRISEYRAKQEEMISRFRMASAYPALMAMVGLGTIIFMLTFVMPRLMQIFINMGQNLPMPTRIVIALSAFLRHYWYYLLVILALSVVILKRQLKTKAGKLSLSLFKLHIPVYGKFALKSELSRFSHTLSLLIKSGIPILKAIEVAIPVLDNEVIKNQLKQSYKELEQGGSFGRSLKNSKLFPLFMTNLLIVGEESGKLDDALFEVANIYERETDEAIRVMTSLLEPLMILVMGLIVGFIVVAMLLPIFEINVMAR